MAKNVNDHLTEMLGKRGSVEIFGTAAQTSKNFYAVYFPVDSVISSIQIANATGDSTLQTTLPAGTTLFMNITGITLGSGIGVGYNN